VKVQEPLYRASFKELEAGDVFIEGENESLLMKLAPDEDNLFVKQLDSNYAVDLMTGIVSECEPESNVFVFPEASINLGNIR
jgi:hypothetical protein